MTPVPVVSVCIPCYNGATHLAECLDSVRAQTFADFEVVLLDDGSTDGTLDIAHRYAARDPRLRVSAGAGRAGMVANWNRAVAAARGEWVKLLFQDDLLMPRCIETLLEHARRNDALFAASLREIRIEGPLSKSMSDLYARNRSLVASLHRPGKMTAAQVADFALAQLGNNFVGEPSVTLIHKRVFEKLGGFDPALVQRVDTEFWVRAGIHFGVAVACEELAVFRVHGGAASAANYAGRNFADQYLDPAVFLHQFLFDAKYAPLRARLRDKGLTGNVEARYAEVCRRAARIVKQAAGPDAEQIRADWRRLAGYYPAIARTAEQVPL